MIALNRNQWFDYHVESMRQATAALPDTRKILYATFTALPGKEAASTRAILPLLVIYVDLFRTDCLSSQEVAALIAGLQVPTPGKISLFHTHHFTPVFWVY